MLVDLFWGWVLVVRVGFAAFETFSDYCDDVFVGREEDAVFAPVDHPRYFEFVQQ